MPFLVEEVKFTLKFSFLDALETDRLWICLISLLRATLN